MGGNRDKFNHWNGATSQRCLLGAEGDGGVHGKYPHGWDNRRGDADKYDEAGARGKRRRVGWRDLPQQRGEQPRDRERAGHADAHAGSEHHRRPAENEADHLRAAGAERHADPDFPRSLRDAVRHHTVNADGREEDRRPRKHAEKKRNGPRILERPPQRVVEQLHIAHGHLRIDLSRGVPNRRNRAQRIARRAQQERHLDARACVRRLDMRRALSKGDVQHGLWLVLPDEWGRVACNAHDFARLLVSRQLQREPLADRVGIGPETSRHRFADHGDPWRGDHVAIGELAALHERYLHGSKIAVAHGGVQCIVRVLAGGSGSAFHSKRHVVCAVERQQHGSGRRLHAGDRPCPLEEIGEDLVRPGAELPGGQSLVLVACGFSVLRPRHRHLKRQHAWWVGVQRRVHEPQETSREKAGAGERHEREGELAGDQDHSQPLRPGAGGDDATELANGTALLRRRGVKRGHEAEDEAGRHRCGDAEEEHRRIERNLVQPRSVGRRKRDEHAETAPSEEYAQRAADQRQDEALDEELPDQLPAAGADRQPNRDFSVACRRSSEQEAGDIRAGDEQQERDSALQKQQRARKPADEFLLHRLEVYPPRLAVHGADLRKLLSDASRDDVDVALRRRHRDAWLQTPENRDVARRPLQLLVVEEERLEKLPLIAEQLEVGVDDADDGDAAAVHADGLAEDLRVAREAPPPQPFADQDDRRGMVDLVLGGRKQSAANRSDAKLLQKLRRATLAGDALGRRAVFFRAERTRVRPGGAQRGERAVLASPREIVGDGGAVIRVGLIGRYGPDKRQLAGIGKRQRLEQNRPDQREDRGIRADAEREHKDRGDGEPGSSWKTAEGKAYVPQGGLEAMKHPRLPRFFPAQRGAAEPATSFRRGVCGRRARFFELVTAHGQMKRDLIVQIALQAATTDKGKQTAPERSQLSHLGAPKPLARHP